MKASRRRTLLRSIVLCAAAVVVLFVSLKIIDRLQNKNYPETRSAGTDEFMQSNDIVANGRRYRKIPAVTMILISGIDNDDGIPSGISTSNYRNGGQADFLLLITIDHTNRQIRQLQIDRDTMTEMTILSVFGVETGTRVQQICLSHNYGANKEENAHYTIRAVRNLLNDIAIDGYYMVNYSAVPVLNDILGGVTVTIPDDMTSVNELWKKGTVITLKGKDAETFVRTRQTIGRGTNEERMVRQNEFMSSAITQLRLKLSSDSEFGTKFISAMREFAATNYSDQQLAEEFMNAVDYDIQPVQYLDGEYKISDSGYIEFYAEENSMDDWMISNLYFPISEGQS